jgi:hypothetical protein
MIYARLFLQNYTRPINTDQSSTMIKCAAIRVHGLKCVSEFRTHITNYYYNIYKFIQYSCLKYRQISSNQHAGTIPPKNHRRVQQTNLFSF